MAARKAWIAWSTGKDAAWALDVVRKRGDLAVVGLLAVITEPFARVSMHGVHSELLDEQMKAIGLPVHRVLIPAKCSEDVYADAMRRILAEATAEGVRDVVFGDILLADVRSYREERMAEAGFTAHFPLWKRDTLELARQMITAGLRATVTCLDSAKLPREMAGVPFDEAFLAGLPDGVDPCGENGEFHTFVWNLPGLFGKPLRTCVGEIVEREGFVFADLLRLEGVAEA